MEQTEKQLTEPTAQTAQPEQAATEQATQPDTKEERGNAAFAAMRRAKESAEKQVKALSEEHADTEALRAERDQLREFHDRTVVEKDIAEVRRVYPDFKAEGLAELPEEFIRIMATGLVDPVTAYEVMRANEARRNPAPPPETGRIRNEDAAPKEFYSPEEVDRLTGADFKRDKNLLRIVQKSMTKWR